LHIWPETTRISRVEGPKPLSAPSLESTSVSVYCWAFDPVICLAGWHIWDSAHAKYGGCSGRLVRFSVAKFDYGRESPSRIGLTRVSTHPSQKETRLPEEMSSCDLLPKPLPFYKHDSPNHILANYPRPAKISHFPRTSPHEPHPNDEHARVPVPP
jgi:hypothetical protein